MFTRRKNIAVKLIALLMLLVMVSSAFAISTSAEEDINLAIDVMFVIDGSGSMFYNDPGYVAMSACNLFADMCDYGQARAGFVVYSTDIVKEYPLSPLTTAADRQNLKNSINSVKYPEVAGTDISLGLTKGMNMLVEGGALAEDRFPMIILLSDGKTEYISTQRQQEYHDELNGTLKYLSGDDDGDNIPERERIPVYTIGLGTDETKIDVDTMKNIAEATGAFYSPANTAEELPSLLGKIMADRLRSPVVEVEEIVATGEEQSVMIEMPAGIYQANVTLLSANGVSNLRLHAPDGNEVKIPSDKVLLGKGAAYDLVKIIQPASGNWKLSFTGVKDDLISINLISAYDIQFMLMADKQTVTNGNAVTFNVYCNSLMDGESATDIFDGSEGTLTIKNVVTNDIEPLDFKWNGTELTASHTFSKAGKYEVSGRILGKDGSYDRQTDTIEIVVNPMPLKLLKSSSEESCFSPILGIKIKSEVELPITGIVSSDPDATLTVSPVPGGWENVCGFDYDANTGEVTVSALKGGNAAMKIKITDSFGQSVEYSLKVKVTSGWLIVGAILLGLALIALVIFLVIRANTPLTNGYLKVSVTLPGDMTSQTPPEAMIDLAVLNKKGKFSLIEALNSNLSFGNAYAQVLSGISGFVNKLYFEVMNKDYTKLAVYIPNPGNGMKVQYDNAIINGKAKKELLKGYGVSLTLSSPNGYSYTIRLEYSSGENNGFFGGGGAGDFGGGFGGGSGSFGGFGGSSDSSSGGFGGFGNSGNSGNNSGGFGSGSNDGFNAF